MTEKEIPIGVSKSDNCCGVDGNGNPAAIVFNHKKNDLSVVS